MTAQADGLCELIWINDLELFLARKGTKQAIKN